MANNNTLRIRKLSQNLTNVLKSHQEASLVENRHRTIRATLHALYPNLIESTEKELMINFIKDVTYVDRLLRRKTEGKQNLRKTILSQEFQLAMYKD